MRLATYLSDRAAPAYNPFRTFLNKEEAALREATRSPETAIDATPAGRATRFLEANLQYPTGSFDAVLLWDLLDYFEPSMAAKTVASITQLLRPGGVVFAMFHS